MTAIEMIKELFTLKGYLLESAAKSADFTDNETLLRSVARWAAKISGEDEDNVVKDTKAFMTDDELSVLRDFLEIGLKPWKFEGQIFGSREQYDDWLSRRVLVTVHRGTNQIGGSITEITMGRTSVLVDLGSRLPGSQGTISDEVVIEKIFNNHRRFPKEHHISAVFFTHYHGDHVGLIAKIPEDIPIYMDPAMLEVLRTLHKHTGNTAMQELLANSSGRIQDLTLGKLFTIGDMNIVPFFVDHSAYHANMFLFESKITGHTVLHSGDFRGTGYMSKSLDIIPKLIHDRYHKQVDVLLTEGTMMTRDVHGPASDGTGAGRAAFAPASMEKEHLLTEWDLHKEAKAFMKDHRQILVLCSSTNFDSLTSICNAAKANNIPIYGSPYIIDMIKTFSDMAGKKMWLYNLPTIKSIREYFDCRDGEYVVLLGSLLGRGIEKAEELYHNYGKSKKAYRPHLIYSMWQGYLNPRHPAYDEGLAAFVGQFDGRVKAIHSSGHADRDTLAKFINDIAPRKYIVPFHTEDAAGFKALHVEDKYKDMIILPDDGDTIEIA